MRRVRSARTVSSAPWMTPAPAGSALVLLGNAMMAWPAMASGAATRTRTPAFPALRSAPAPPRVTRRPRSVLPAARVVSSPAAALPTGARSRAIPAGSATLRSRGRLTRRWSVSPAERVPANARSRTHATRPVPANRTRPPSARRAAATLPASVINPTAATRRANASRTTSRAVPAAACCPLAVLDPISATAPAAVRAARRSGPRLATARMMTAMVPQTKGSISVRIPTIAGLAAVPARAEFRARTAFARFRSASRGLNVRRVANAKVAYARAAPAVRARALGFALPVNRAPALVSRWTTARPAALWAATNAAALAPALCQRSSAVASISR